MIYRKDLLANLQIIKNKLKNRNFNLDIEYFQKLNNEYIFLKQETEKLLSLKNKKTKEIELLKKNNNNTQSLISNIINIKENIKNKKILLNNVKKNIHIFLSYIPNIPSDTSPIGNSEQDNILIKTEGEIKKTNYIMKDHTILGKYNNNIDFNNASKITSNNFVILKDHIAKLHRAIIQFMLDIHTQKNKYTELYVPYMVNDESLFGTGQIPKFNDEIFTIKNSFNKSLNLIPTAEVPITNIVRNNILNEKDLPLKFVAHSPCFRKEVGSYGNKNKGILRQYQFDKVELVQITKPEEGEKTLQQLTKHAEIILQQLKLPYRIIELCTNELNFSSKKTYDIEVWIPSQKKYQEISSCSWCGDFQAKRMKTRFKDTSAENKKFVHTLNGSGLAVGRTLVAILENYQTDNNTIEIPEVLIPYMNNMKHIIIK